MTSEPVAPGAKAIYLYRQVDRDDSGNARSAANYVRIAGDERNTAVLKPTSK